MRPIPTAFHIGPLEVHTYGIGLALTFWFAFWYFERRLKARGYPIDWVPGMFLWVIVAAVVGARALHVLTHIGDYTHQPAEVLAVWHGGLSSFGGLLLAIPVGLVITRRRCPELSLARVLDIVAPVLMAAWAMGRLLGPQLMVSGGGHPSSQWFCMYYDGQRGCRLPVPIFQAIEDFSIFVVLIVVERHLDRLTPDVPDRERPTGVVLGLAMMLWGIARAVDERLWLGEDGHLGSLLVQVAGVALVAGGVVVLVLSRRNWRRWREAGGRPPPAMPAVSSPLTPSIQGSPGAESDRRTETT
jgi:phosphatidylglycerol:prolipoprotein diacylglycerol transferase